MASKDSSIINVIMTPRNKKRNDHYHRYLPYRTAHLPDDQEEVDAVPSGASAGGYFVVSVKNPVLRFRL